MAREANFYASKLRLELCARSRLHARGRLHVESYGASPVIVYAPDQGCHGNFFDAAYAAIAACPAWMRRFDKVHAQAARSLPKAERRWRELDSSTSSDALLMNIFCTPGVLESASVRRLLGVDTRQPPVFGWKARVPLSNGRFDRTEVDMRWDQLLVEAKLTEADFQTGRAELLATYRDFDTVFDRELLPLVEIPAGRRRQAAEFPEDYSQEELIVPAGFCQPPQIQIPRECITAFASYQLIRNVLAAHSAHASFCVLHDARRPDLREAWFSVLRAVQSAELRVRLKVLTWQELAAALPQDLQTFLAAKYGIIAPGSANQPSPR